MKYLFLVAMIILCQRTQSTISIEQYAERQGKNLAVLFQNQELDSEQHFPEIQKLMFLTPWNKKGFQYTIKYSHKLDYVSPCWYTLQLSPKNLPQFQNEHNYDQKYTKQIKAANNHIKIVPRIYIQGNNIKFFQSIGSNKQSFDHAVNLVHRIITQKKFDGFVFDTPFNFFQLRNKQLNQLITQLIKSIRRKIGPQKIIFLNMANPMNTDTLDMDSYNSLAVDYIMIQNYDKGDNYLQMVEGSINWSKKVRRNIKIMLMLPFFSVKVNYGSISTEEAVASIKRFGVMEASVSEGICRYVENKSKRAFLIPCLAYFKCVFKRASEQSAGVGFWQGGNGLQNYYKFL